jgi:hypothetical protein
MNFNKWTLALAAAGVVSLGSVAQAEEAQNQVLTALSSTTLSGYISTSAIWKFGEGNGPMDAGYYGAGKMDGFNLDAVKLSLSKPLDEGQWSAGYTFDLVFGPDAEVFEAGQGALADDMAIQNAFVLLRAPVGNGVDIKMGAFDTLIGYESFDYPKNPNWSRSYGYGIEPTQHTGVTLAYQFTEWLRIEGGVANTLDGPINARSRFANGEESETEKTYLGLVTLTAPESFGAMAGSQLYLGIVDGIDASNGFDADGTYLGNYFDTTSLYAGLTAKTPVEGLLVGAAFDYLDAKVDAGGTKEDADSYAIGGYLIYQATEKLTIADRFEYANFEGIDADAGEYDFDVIANTLTVDYKLWANVKTRAELRWDHSLEDDYEIYGDGDEDSVWLGLNVIYQF